MLLTNELHIVSPAVLRDEQLPPDLKVTKVFYERDVNNMQQELESVREMGQAAMEEWQKGLDDRGRKLMSDSQRWEKWASTGGLSQLRTDMESMRHIRDPSIPIHQRKSGE